MAVCAWMIGLNEMVHDVLLLCFFPFFFASFSVPFSFLFLPFLHFTNQISSRSHLSKKKVTGKKKVQPFHSQEGSVTPTCQSQISNCQVSLIIYASFFAAFIDFSSTNPGLYLFSTFFPIPLTFELSFSFFLLFTVCSWRFN